ncbi:MAG TPA: DUF1361 domain-containing protein [Chitinophagaceae bacterium]|nr:DUF1361 domain-containing protein [Chitinophagaceae bacterium]
MKSLVFTLRSQFPRMLKSELQRWLAASMLFSVLLVSARIVYTGQLSFIFLVWNLFLAYVPYVLTSWLRYRPDWIESPRKFAAVFIAWLLFIPNSFYIITDLFHLHIYGSIPGWYELALLLSFAWNGILLGILSLRQMETIVRVRFPYSNELLFIYPIMWLNALGIYIGRYLRFNSWDVITSPFGLIADIADIIMHPIAYKSAWGMIFCYSFLMTLIYVTIKKIRR